MAIFGQNPKKQYPDQNSKSENAKTADNTDIAAAEYPYFHIHQIKAWSGWSVNQEEVDYTVDPPLYLNK